MEKKAFLPVLLLLCAMLLAGCGRRGSRDAAGLIPEQISFSRIVPAKKSVQNTKKARDKISLCPWLYNSNTIPPE